jgi:hypothetical protein
MRAGAGLVRSILSLLFMARSGQAEPPDEPHPPSAGPAPVIASVPVVRPLPLTPRLARETVAAAFRAAGSSAMREHISSLATRARSSALLPDLSVRLARSTDDSLRSSPTLDDPYRYLAAGGAGLWLEARVAWHFDRLVFDRDEVTVERLRREHSSDLARLAARVLDVLFTWQRASVRVVDPKATSEELEQATLAQAEAETTLDLLTDGWFAARLKAKMKDKAP